MDYKIIHITGTNGKGSTATNIKNILKLTKHVGLFTSPFILFFNERIMVNDRYISDSEIMYYGNKLKEYSDSYYEKYHDVIPFFELTLLMALMFFEDRSIDVAVIECGLGGLLDSTNFVKSDLAIITNVGLDHMAQLGNTIYEIADHKLGIVKDNGKAITCACMELDDKFNSYAKEHNATILNIRDKVSDIKTSNVTTFKYKGMPFETPLLGEYQAYNAALAIKAVKEIYPDYPLELIKAGLAETKMPGRFEYVKSNVILDGAHNISAVSELVTSVKKIFPDKKIKIMYTALVDKAYDKMLKKLDEIASYYYFTSINDTRRVVATTFKDYTAKDYEVIDNLSDCINKALKELKNDEILLITGSLHFVSTVRREIIK